MGESPPIFWTSGNGRFSMSRSLKVGFSFGLRRAVVRLGGRFVRRFASSDFDEVLGGSGVVFAHSWRHGRLSDGVTLQDAQRSSLFPRVGNPSKGVLSRGQRLWAQADGALPVNEVGMAAERPYGKPRAVEGPLRSTWREVRMRVRRPRGIFGHQ